MDEALDIAIKLQQKDQTNGKEQIHMDVFG